MSPVPGPPSRWASAWLAVLGGAVGLAVAGEPAPIEIDISIHYSHYQPAAIVVPAGRPITFVIHNTDPIDHEWIVGDEAVHQRHRTGTEPYHAARPTEVTIDAGTTRDDDRHVQRRPGSSPTSATCRATRPTAWSAW